MVKKKNKSGTEVQISIADITDQAPTTGLQLPSEPSRGRYENNFRKYDYSTSKRVFSKNYSNDQSNKSYQSYTHPRKETVNFGNLKFSSSPNKNFSLKPNPNIQRASTMTERTPSFTPPRELTRGKTQDHDKKIKEWKPKSSFSIGKNINKNEDERETIRKRVSPTQKIENLRKVKSKPESKFEGIKWNALPFKNRDKNLKENLSKPRDYQSGRNEERNLPRIISSDPLKIQKIKSLKNDEKLGNTKQSSLKKEQGRKETLDWGKLKKKSTGVENLKSKAPKDKESKKVEVNEGDLKIQTLKEKEKIRKTKEPKSSTIKIDKEHTEKPGKSGDFKETKNKETVKLQKMPTKDKDKSSKEVESAKDKDKSSKEVKTTTAKEDESAGKTEVKSSWEKYNEILKNEEKEKLKKKAPERKKMTLAELMKNPLAKTPHVRPGQKEDILSVLSKKKIALEKEKEQRRKKEKDERVKKEKMESERLLDGLLSANRNEKTEFFGYFKNKDKMVEFSLWRSGLENTLWNKKKNLDTEFAKLTAWCLREGILDLKQLSDELSDLISNYEEKKDAIEAGNKAQFSAEVMLYFSETYGEKNTVSKMSSEETSAASFFGIEDEKKLEGFLRDHGISFLHTNQKSSESLLEKIKERIKKGEKSPQTLKFLQEEKANGCCVAPMGARVVAHSVFARFISDLKKSLEECILFTPKEESEEIDEEDLEEREEKNEFDYYTEEHSVTPGVISFFEDKLPLLRFLSESSKEHQREILNALALESVKTELSKKAIANLMRAAYICEIVDFDGFVDWRFSDLPSEGKGAKELRDARRVVLVAASPFLDRELEEAKEKVSEEYEEETDSVSEDDEEQYE